MTDTILFSLGCSRTLLATDAIQRAVRLPGYRRHQKRMLWIDRLTRPMSKTRCRTVHPKEEKICCHYYFPLFCSDSRVISRNELQRQCTCAKWYVYNGLKKMFIKNWSYLRMATLLGIIPFVRPDVYLSHVLIHSSIIVLIENDQLQVLSPWEKLETLEGNTKCSWQGCNLELPSFYCHLWIASRTMTNFQSTN